jgi:hypothetical protein
VFCLRKEGEKAAKMCSATAGERDRGTTGEEKVGAEKNKKDGREFLFVQEGFIFWGGSIGAK